VEVSGKNHATDGFIYPLNKMVGLSRTVTGVLLIKTYFASAGIKSFHLRGFFPYPKQLAVGTILRPIKGVPVYFHREYY